MVIKKDFLLRKSAVLGLSAAFISLMHGSSYAAKPELSFYPAKGWSVVEEGENTVSTSGKICQISSEFNNGFVVEIQGNRKWVQSISVNFRQDIFNPGQSYDATLTVPGNETQNVAGEAINKKVISLDLSRKKQFYQDLRESGVLDLGLEGNAFRFFLTGFGSAARKFESCMASSQVLPKTAHNKLRALDENEATVNEARAFEEAESQNLAFQDNPQDLSPRPVEIEEMDIQAEDVAISDDTTEILETIPYEPAPQRRRMTEELAAEINANPSLADIREEKPAEKDNMPEPIDLLKQPETKESSGPKEEVRPNPEAENTSEIETAFAGETEAETIKMTKVKPEAPPKNDVNVTKTTTRVEADFTDAGNPESIVPMPLDPPKNKREDFAQLDTTSPSSGEAGERQASYSNENYASLARKISSLEKNIALLERENIALNEELKASLEASEQERLSISSENWNLERATMRFNEAERQIQRLGMQLQQERAQCDLEKQELESMLFDPQLTSEQQLAKLADLRQKLEEAQQKAEDQRMRYEERIRILEEQLAGR